jgi:hypothetical protein
MIKKVIFIVLSILFISTFYSNAESINYEYPITKTLIYPINIDPYYVQIHRSKYYDLTCGSVGNQFRSVVLF